MAITGIDHLVLCVSDVAATVRFYRDVIGLEAREERPGKWSLHAGAQKISLQDAADPPAAARATVPGSGNFCLLTDEAIAQVAERLRAGGTQIETGPAERLGAAGPIMSIYLRDPDGNLVEISEPI